MTTKIYIACLVSDIYTEGYDIGEIIEESEQWKEEILICGCYPNLEKYDPGVFYFFDSYFVAFEIYSVDYDDCLSIPFTKILESVALVQEFKKYFGQDDRDGGTVKMYVNIE